MIDFLESTFFFVVFKQGFKIKFCQELKYESAKQNRVIHLAVYKKKTCASGDLLVYQIQQIGENSMEHLPTKYPPEFFLIAVSTIRARMVLL